MTDMIGGATRASRGPGWVWGGPALAAAIALGACGGDPPKADGVEMVTGASTGTVLDDTAAPMHVQIKQCTTDTSQSQQAVDCTVDSGFALVGGGAYILSGTGSSALLTASAPVDGRTWHAASHDHLITDPHLLTVYAVGIRLDGVSAATLRNRIGRLSITQPQINVDTPSVTVGSSGVLSGGVTTNTSGPGQFITQSFPSPPSGWAASSQDHLQSSPGTLTDTLIQLSPAGIIEGFGALEIQQQIGPAKTVSSGPATVTGTVTPGWAVLGYGAQATTTGGPGRMLYRFGMTALNDTRTVIAGSRDVQQPSSGTTTVAWTQGRWMVNSHGLCNPGTALALAADPCVGNVCAADPYCCQAQWDTICVGEVPTYCGRSCANDTCSVPGYTPAFWTQAGVQASNSSYNYATNHRTDTYAQPGRAAGEFCPGGGCIDAPTLAFEARNDGLIPTPANTGCGGGRSLLALAVAPGVDQLWYRVDSLGHWSYKIGAEAPSNLDFAGHVITSPETASRGFYTQFGGYFCACSSSVEGQGHTTIN
jgi:hypothetical protein